MRIRTPEKDTEYKLKRRKQGSTFFVVIHERHYCHGAVVIIFVCFLEAAYSSHQLLSRQENLIAMLVRQYIPRMHVLC